MVMTGLAAGALFMRPAFAGYDTLQTIHELEWRRVDPHQLADVEVGSSSERAALARALGQLRNEDSLGPLYDLLDGGNTEVRRAVFEAFGNTPGTASVLRQELLLDPVVETTRWPASRMNDLRPVLLDGLGRQGDETDVPRLIEALSWGSPSAIAAADALARFGRRGIRDADSAVPALVAATGRLDSQVVDAAAHALWRIGMGSAPVESAWEAVEHLPTASSTAWVTRALWPALDVPRRQALFSMAMKSDSGAIRVAALNAVSVGDLEVRDVESWLSSPDGWVSSSAIAALGRLATPDANRALTAHMGQADPWEAAEAALALAAAGAPLAQEVALDRTRAAPIRAAVASSVVDVEALGRLIADPAPMVRSAAAEGLVAAAPRVPIDRLRAMLVSDDAVVRHTAVQILKKREEDGVPSGDWVVRLVKQLRVETDADVLAAGYDLLRLRATANPKDFLPGETLLLETVRRGLTHPDVPVRSAAEGLKTTLQLAIEPEAPRPRPLVPSLSDVETIRSARVFTNRGEFRLVFVPEAAPLAVANFAALAEEDFYDGTVIHRAVPAFVIQTGDPRADGSGGPGWTIPDEVSRLPYRAGAVGMARADYDTGGGQWFVTLTDHPHLVGDYTLFAYVNYGMPVVRRLGRGDVIRDVQIERVASRHAVP
jgi:peptidyl-prolyl cis-trans isomerase B (cyclophilin B)